MGGAASISDYSTEDLKLLAEANIKVQDIIDGKVDVEHLQRIKMETLSGPVSPVSTADGLKVNINTKQITSNYECSVCRVKFERKHLLDRHVGFSTIHARKYCAKVICRQSQMCSLKLLSYFKLLWTERRKI